MSEEIILSQDKQEGQSKESLPVLSQEDIIRMSSDYAQDVANYINQKISAAQAPFPLAVILNAVMFIYVSTVVNSVPKEMRRSLIEDHFNRIMKDLENGEKPDQSGQVP